MLRGARDDSGEKVTIRLPLPPLIFTAISAAIAFEMLHRAIHEVQLGDATGGCRRGQNEHLSNMMFFWAAVSSGVQTTSRRFTSPYRTKVALPYAGSVDYNNSEPNPAE